MMFLKFKVRGRGITFLKLFCNHFHNILRLFDALSYFVFNKSEKIFAQMKQCMIVTYKYGIYELPHELQNDIRS